MLDPRTSDLLKRYVTAGAAAGGGLALGTSVANYLNYLRAKAKKQKSDTSADDDILYIDVPQEKQASISLTGLPGVGSGIAITGGAVSLGVAHALVKMLYNAQKKKMLQKDLDEAQQMYWDTEAGPLNKTAAQKPVSSLELVSGSPVALTLLAAIASGLLTNKALNKSFPSREEGIDPIKANKPKQVKIRYKEPMEKTSSAKEMCSAMDFVVASLIDGLDKEASYLPDLVAQTAQGGLDAFLENVYTVGPTAALELVKGAAQADLDPDIKYLAICALNRHPETSPLVSTLVEAEVLDRLPYFHKLASEIETEDQEVITKLAAAISSDIAHGVIDRFTNKGPKSEDEAEEEPDEEEAEKKGYSVLSSVLEQHKSKPKKKEEEDPIDKAFSGE